jgi:hypothetical protein
MSNGKLDTSGVFSPLEIESNETHLSLPTDAVKFHKNGVVFECGKAIPIWTEMTVDLRSPRDGKRIRGNGVVVACHGNRHSGFSVAMVFLNLTPQSSRALNALAFA